MEDQVPAAEVENRVPASVVEDSAPVSFAETSAPMAVEIGDAPTDEQPCEKRMAKRRKLNVVVLDDAGANDASESVTAALRQAAANAQNIAEFTRAQSRWSAGQQLVRLSNCRLMVV